MGQKTGLAGQEDNVGDAVSGLVDGLGSCADLCTGLAPSPHGHDGQQAAHSGGK